MAANRKMVGIILACVLVGGGIGAYFIYQYIDAKRDLEEEQAKAAQLEILLMNIFQSQSPSDMAQYFDDSVLSEINIEFLYYFVQTIKLGYGDYVDVAVSLEKESGMNKYNMTLTFAVMDGLVNLNKESQKISGIYFSSFAIRGEILAQTTLAQLTSRYTAIPGNHSLLIKQDTQTLYALNSTDTMQIASAFKLFVLHALEQKINQDPGIDWNTQIPIIDQYKSLPSGEFQNEDNGTLFTLQEMADDMISISDNTATDHIIYYLGREYVESFLPPTYDFPLLTTNEAFKIRFLLPTAKMEEYVGMSISNRRQFLAVNVSQLDINDINLYTSNWTGNIALQMNFEWALSAEQLYTGLTLAKNVSSLYINPGVADAAEWAQAGYKGGSDVGTLSMAHVVQHANGTWFYCVMVVNNYSELDFIADEGLVAAYSLAYMGMTQLILAKLAQGS